MTFELSLLKGKDIHMYFSNGDKDDFASLTDLTQLLWLSVNVVIEVILFIYRQRFH